MTNYIIRKYRPNHEYIFFDTWEDLNKEIQKYRFKYVTVIDSLIDAFRFGQDHKRSKFIAVKGYKHLGQWEIWHN
jgi:hypothetical protein